MAEVKVPRCSTLVRKPRHWFSRVLPLILTLMILAVCTGFAENPADKPARPGSGSGDAGITEKLGIKPVAIRITAAGNMVDFRYNVLDARKSLPTFDRKVKTYLIDQATGDRFDVPKDTKLGPLRSSSKNPVAGKEYFIFFTNPGKILKRGNKVTVVFGDFKIENLTIE